MHAILTLMHAILTLMHAILTLIRAIGPPQALSLQILFDIGAYPDRPVLINPLVDPIFHRIATKLSLLSDERCLHPQDRCPRIALKSPSNRPQIAKNRKDRPKI